MKHEQHDDLATKQLSKDTLYNIDNTHWSDRWKLINLADKNFKDQMKK